MENIPYIAVGNGELKNQPEVSKGTIIMHQHENGEWEESEIKYGEKVNDDGTKEESSLLGFYKLKDGTTYMASLAGKLMNRKNLKLK